jgi:hypothetical protein
MSIIKRLRTFAAAAACLGITLAAPDEEAVRKYHAALGVGCGAVHRVEGVS